TLAAPTAAALRAGGQDRTAPTPGAGEPPRGVWLPGGRRAPPGPTGLAHQHGLRGADQLHHPAACGRGRATGQHPVQGRRWLAAAVGCVSLLLQFLCAPCQHTPAPATARAHPRDRRGHAVAAVYAGHGSGAHRPCLDTAAGAAVPRATVARASRGVNIPWWWEAVREAGLYRRRASAQPVARASPGESAPLRCPEGPPV